MTTLKEGDKAPDFTLKDAYGKSYTLSSFRDKSPVVLYFYPKAGTTGCTKEACGIRDDMSKFRKNNITVLGVSVDSKEAIKKFIDDYHLNFPLLSDKDKNISRDYGVLNKLGVDNRITFIIDKKGIISSIIRDVDVTTHSEQAYNLASKLL
ncbi:MAG: peroxiredoxin [Ignavibacteria bacterium]|nr:peroxiredoxin [Ignavibacteria bacterium]MCU7498534.1 peroxiredoxin [Ignavibacteria bacterium]MCU7511665.1 peroxiredoxin [Ignavibacteria bacterium]MCU7519121.1 peroxiredoxin [Ignavibacteria bacterium]MCU7523751.1 peroxiredoxin [Ignavibacteria bacterium]